MTTDRNADEQVVLLHNPRCSKSRAVRAMLAERGVSFVERRYLDDPLTIEELYDLQTKLGLPPSRWIRTGEPAWSELGLDGSEPDARLLEAVAAEPVLLQRPILVRGDRALIGRPPEAVLPLLDG